MKKLLTVIKVLLTCGLVTNGIAEANEMGEKHFNETLQISGTLSGYVLTGNKINEDNKKSRIEVASAILTITGKTKLISWVLQGGAYAFPTVGVDHVKTTDHTELYGPVPVAYFDLNLTDNFLLSVGRMGTLIGFESPFTFQNSYIQRGLVWNMQSLFHHGLRATFLKDPLTLKIGLNDGYYSLGVDSLDQRGKKIKEASLALEFSSSLKFRKDLILSLNMLIPKKDAYPNEVVDPANKRQFNLVLTNTRRNLMLGLDALYVCAPRSARAGVFENAYAHGVAFHLNLDRSPYKVALRLEHVKDKKEDNTDLIGLGNGNRVYTLTLTPSYQRKNWFIRNEISYVKAQEPFTSDKRKDQFRIGLETGFSF